MSNTEFVSKLLVNLKKGKLSNDLHQDLLDTCQQEDMATIIVRRHWNFLRRDTGNIIKTALL